MKKIARKTLTAADEVRILKVVAATRSGAEQTVALSVVAVEMGLVL